MTLLLKCFRFQSLRKFSTDSPAVNLSLEARRQLNVEIAGEASDPCARLPPLPPAGWVVNHTPGTRTLQLNRTVTYNDLDKRECRGGLISSARLFAGRPTGSTHSSDAEELMIHRKAREARLKRQLKASDTYCNITVHAALAVQDWSFWDPNVRIGEWAPFDAVVEKPLDRIHHASARLLAGQSPPVVRRHMLLGFASADAQLRFRRLQFLTEQEAWALTSSGRLAAPIEGNTLVSCGATGSFAGPNVGRLGKELTDNLLEYAFLLGIDGALAEFVCQMLHYMEHQEYLAWLARLADFSDCFTTSNAFAPEKPTAQLRTHHDL